MSNSLSRTDLLLLDAILSLEVADEQLDRLEELPPGRRPPHTFCNRDDYNALVTRSQIVQELMESLADLLQARVSADALAVLQACRAHRDARRNDGCSCTRRHERRHQEEGNP
jgi:hypothetical protein